MRLQLLKTLFLISLLGVAFTAFGEKKNLSWTNNEDFQIEKIKVGDDYAAAADQGDTNPNQVETGKKVFALIKVKKAGHVVNTLAVSGATPAPTKENIPSLAAGQEVWSFTMPAADATITLTFKAKSYQLSFTNNEDFQIEKIKVGDAYATAADKGNTASISVETGNKVFALIKVKKAGHVVNTVTVQGATPVKENVPSLEADQEVWSFTMPAADATITLTLKAKSYKLTFAATEKYTVEVFSPETTKVNSEVLIPAGQKVVVKVTPTAENVQLKKVEDEQGNVQLNGVLEENTYTFAMPSGEVKLAIDVEQFYLCTFADGTDYTISAKRGTKTVTSPVKCFENDRIDFTIKAKKAAEFYEIDELSTEPEVSGVWAKGGIENLWYLTMPKQNIKVKATTHLAGKGKKLAWTLENSDKFILSVVEVSTDKDGNETLRNIQKSNKFNVEKDKELRFRVVSKSPTEPYEVVAFKLNGTDIVKDERLFQTWTFKMPDALANVEIKSNPYAIKNSALTWTLPTWTGSQAGDLTMEVKANGTAITSGNAVKEGAAITVKFSFKEGIVKRPARVTLGGVPMVWNAKDKVYTGKMPDKPAEIKALVVENEEPTLTFASKENEYSIVSVKAGGLLALISGKKVSSGVPIEVNVVPVAKVTDAKKQIVAVKLCAKDGTVVTQAMPGDKENRWNFDMPDEDVTITVDIKEIKSYTFSFENVEGMYTVEAKLSDGTSLKNPATVRETQWVKLTFKLHANLTNAGKKISRVFIENMEATKIGLDGFGFSMPGKSVTLRVEYGDVHYRICDFVPKSVDGDKYTVNIFTSPGNVPVDPVTKKVEVGREVNIQVVLDPAEVEAKKVLREVFVKQGDKDVRVKQEASFWVFNMPDADVKVGVLISTLRRLIFTSVIDRYNITATRRGKEVKGSIADVPAKETLFFEIDIIGEAKTAGRTIESVKLGNNVATLENGKWKVEMPDEDARLEVKLTGTDPTKQLTFAAVADQYDISATVDGAAITSPANVMAGKVVVLTIKPAGAALAEKRTIEKVTAGTVTFINEGDNWTFVMPTADIKVEVTLSEPPQKTISLTVNKSGAMESVTYTTKPEKLTGLPLKAKVTFYVTGVPEGKLLKIEGNDKVAGVREVIANEEYLVALSNEDAAVTLSLVDKPEERTKFDVTTKFDPSQAEVLLTVGGTTSDGKNLAEGAELVFTVNLKENIKVENVTFDGAAIAPNDEGKYVAKMPNYDVEFIVTTSKEVPKAVEDPIFASVRIAPNPFSTHLVILTQDLVSGMYELLSMNGHVVAAGAWESAEVRIETEHLAQGIYFLRLTTSRGAQKIFKVVRN